MRTPYLPKLRESYLYVMHNNGPPQGFAGFVKCAPCLETLWFQAPPYQVEYLRMEMPTLRNLHTLSLIVIKGSLNLRDIKSLIATCPNILTFDFSSPLCWLGYTEIDAEVPLTCVHLRLVRLDGFKFHAAQMEFASQLLRCAPALEEMRIFTAYCLNRVGQMVEKTLPLWRRVFPHELTIRTKQYLERQVHLWR